MTTNITATPDTQHTSGLLTPFDVLDIAEAIRHAVQWDCTDLNTRDRQALALLTYVPGLRGITRMLAGKLANGTATLPMPHTLAMHLLDVNSDEDLMSSPSDAEGDAWLNARYAEAVRHAASRTLSNDDELALCTLLLIRDLSDPEEAGIRNAMREPGVFDARQASVLRDLADGLSEKARDDAPHLADLLTYTAERQQMLTAFDVLDIQCALRNAAAADTYQLSPADQQALALLTYWGGLADDYRDNLAWLLTGPAMFPVGRHTSAYLLTLIDLLPEVSEQDVDDWLADRDAETPCVVDRIVTALATDAATRIHQPAGHVLYGALQTVIRIGRPELPLDLVPDAARHEIATAVADLEADGIQSEPQLDPALETLAAHNAEYGNSGSQRTMLIAAILAANGHATGDDAVELARNGYDQRVKDAGTIADDMVKRIRRAKLTAIDDALPHCQHTDERPDLAHEPHSITVEPVTPELRRDSDLPDDATLVVVERHHGRLAKICTTSNDLTVAEYVEWGYDVTIEDLARGIAKTYGATYIATPAVAA